MSARNAMHCAWLFVATLFLLSPPLLASTRTSVSNGVWSNPATWGGSVPADSDDVVIASNTTVTLDRNSAFVHNITVIGSLLGGTDTLFLAGSFDGAGTFDPEKGTVALIGADTQHVAGVRQFYDLLLGDTAYASSWREVAVSITVEHDLTCDLSKDSTAALFGAGLITVGRNLLYIGASSSYSGNILMNDQNGDTVAYLLARPSHFDSSKFGFPPITIAKRDSAFRVIVGRSDSLSQALGDSMEVSADTAIRVESGTLDMARGLIMNRNAPKSVASGPFIVLDSGTRFRMAVQFHDSPKPPFDSSVVPFIACDSGSLFEYYTLSTSPTVEDISYLANNLVGQGYWDLAVAPNAVVGFTYNPVLVQHNLVIASGGMVNAGRTMGPLTGEQDITIRSNVINQNDGPSGPVGNGNDGMQAGNDHWIFDSPGDTSYWTGPGYLAVIRVGPTTTLSIRYNSDSSCDSIWVRDSIVELGASCGGYILGRIFTYEYFIDSSNASGIPSGLGLSITSGTIPFLGATRIMRTAGYPPPGTFGGSKASHTVNRYFHVSPSDGPQSGASNQMAFSYRCNEFDSSDFNQLNFWRSTDNGGTWFEVGRSGANATTNTVLLDTDCVGFPDQGNAFLWALSDQEVDVPLAAGLQYFRGSREGSKVNLSWQTSADPNALGFELYRIESLDTAMIASWKQDKSLCIAFQYGGRYGYVDGDPPATAAVYQLRERLDNGTVSSVQECSVDSLEAPVALKISPNPVVGSGSLQILAQGISGACEVGLYDALGRNIENLPLRLQNGRGTIPLASGVKSGVYFVRIRQNAMSVQEKICILGD